MKKFTRFLIIVFVFAILFFYFQTTFAQLTVFEKNKNYLSYNGEPIFLLTMNPANGSWLVDKFSLAFVDSMVKYGANHTWVMLDNFNCCPYSYTQNTPQGFYGKLETIAQKCHENDIIFGINLFGYGIVKHYKQFSFNKECNCCDGDVGPLTRGAGFYNVNNQEPHVVEVREIQKDILKNIVQATWNYPNVYYSYGWELNTIWSDYVGQWCRWAREYMETEGAKISSQKHLFSLEHSLPLQEAEYYNVDFIVEEDGNAIKVDGMPFVYWSIDGIYRGTPIWNSDLEPKENLYEMRDVCYSGAAGTAPIWRITSNEKNYIKRLSVFFDTVENWCDEPEQEITRLALPDPDIETNFGYDYPPGPCKDVDELIETNEFIVYGIVPSYLQTISAQIGGYYFIDRPFLIETLPEYLEESTMIMTANADKFFASEKYLSFWVTTSARIYIGIDIRKISFPDWLTDWEKHNETVITSDTEYRLYSSLIEPGKHYIPGNAAETSKESHYIVFLKEYIDPDYKLSPEDVLYKFRLCEIDSQKVDRVYPWHQARRLKFEFEQPRKLLKYAVQDSLYFPALDSLIVEPESESEILTLQYILPPICSIGRYYMIELYSGYDNYPGQIKWSNPFRFKIKIKNFDAEMSEPIIKN